MKTISLRSAWQRTHNFMAEQSILLSSTTSSGSSGKLELKYCKANDMIADMLTKGLSGEQSEKLRLMAGVTSIIEHSESRSVEESTCQNVLEHCRVVYYLIITLNCSSRF